MLTMSRLFLLILFVVGCHSQGDSCQDIDKPPNPTSGCCGIQQASEGSANNQLPWMAVIEVGVTSYTGTLISSRHVLTTSLVYFYKIVKVHLGVNKQTQTSNDNKVTINASSVNVQEMFNESVFSLKADDIAIITLAEKAPYNEFIRPICLPTSDVLVSPPDNLRLVQAYWPTVIRITKYRELMFRKSISTLLLKSEKCREIYKLNPETQFIFVDGSICAGGEEGLYLSNGNEEQGIPLMFKETGHYTLVGIYGKYPFHLGKPSVFRNVYPYLPWINSVIAQL